MLIGEVAYPVPLRRTFDYEIPEGLRAAARPGVRVAAPFGPRRRSVGYLLSVREGIPSRPLKLIEDVLDSEPLLPPDLLDLAKWLGRRYGAPPGDCLKALLPKYVHTRPGRTSAAEPATAPARPDAAPAFVLTPGQAAAVEELAERLASRRFSAALLYGVPASGKTEVYLRLMREAVGDGGQALFLLPEISLTRPFFEDFTRRAAFPVALWHSQLGLKTRREAWLGLRRGDIGVVVGARSASLLPFKDLRLVVVDEEQDESYKQEGQSPFYHARDLALERARRTGALVVLGSATPSMETVASVASGATTLLRMPERVSRSTPPPRVEIVERPAGRGPCLSPRLAERIRDRLSRREQVILLVNRRGYSNFVICRKCGWVARCPSCSVAFIHHEAAKKEPASGELHLPDPGTLRCHHCGRRSRVPDVCGGCKTAALSFAGAGTQRVAAELASAFRGAKVLRMDRDTVAKEKLRDTSLYDRFQAGEADILVGTKLVAKGFHFPNVTLVGVVDADTMLHRPDFRAAERTMQLLAQVAGRSGRAEKSGEVVVQTADPGHYAIEALTRGDYMDFAEREIGFRRELGYPPASTLVRAVLSGRNEEAVAEAAEAAAEALRRALPEPDFEVLGPSPGVYQKLRGKFRHHLLVKSKREGRLEAALEALGKLELSSTVKLQVDVDPYDLF